MRWFNQIHSKLDNFRVRRPGRGTKQRRSTSRTLRTETL